MATYWKHVKRPFTLNRSHPKSLRVVDTADPNSKTITFSVVADYGWAEKILCSGSYKHDANDIAEMLSDDLDIPVTLAE